MSRHTHEPPHLDELARDDEVLAARLHVSLRVGVGGDDGRLEHLARLDDARGEAAKADLRQADDRVGRIEEHDDELLLFRPGEVHAQHGRHVGRRKHLLFA